MSYEAAEMVQLTPGAADVLLKFSGSRASSCPNRTMKANTMMMRVLLALCALGLACCSAGMGRGKVGLEAYKAYDRPAKLPKDPSAVKVKVSLSRQRAYVMEGDAMLLAMPVSVGAAKSPTPTGDFRILAKDAKHRHGNHGYAYEGERVKRTHRRDKPAGWSFKGTPMPYWCAFRPDLGFHAGWVRHSPCTDGGIRMHENLAPKFFRLVSVGTPVNIVYSQPEDGKWAHMPLPPDAGPLPNYPDSMFTGDGYFTRHKTPEFD
jgi:hypothetical protein